MKTTPSPVRCCTATLASHPRAPDSSSSATYKLSAEISESNRLTASLNASMLVVLPPDVLGWTTQSRPSNVTSNLSTWMRIPREPSTTTLIARPCLQWPVLTSVSVTYLPRANSGRSESSTLTKQLDGQIRNIDGVSYMIHCSKGIATSSLAGIADGGTIQLCTQKCSADPRCQGLNFSFLDGSCYHHYIYQNRKFGFYPGGSGRVKSADISSAEPSVDMAGWVSFVPVTQR